jgi:hypothetical protein
VYTIHATKKPLDRVKAPVGETVLEPSTALCNWYAISRRGLLTEAILLEFDGTLHPEPKSRPID